MKRIVLDTRSNRLFRGTEVEQNYDQRGGLCQVGHGHVVVTMNAIEPTYLAYWQNLGFSLPHFITVGPFDPRYTLSELILQKKEVQAEIKACTQDCQARLEFAYIEQSEAELAHVLGIPTYCNVALSLNLSRKIHFKEVCTRLSLPTPPWFYHPDPALLLAQGKEWMLCGDPIMIKVNDGTGGIPFGAMFKVDTVPDFEEVLSGLHRSTEKFFVERLIADKIADVALHWEITEEGELIIIELFEQITKNFSYGGVSFPARVSQPLRNMITSQLQEKLGPYLVQQGGKGYFCCDLIIDAQGNPHWVDFNPRKGAILYVWDMVRRLANIRFQATHCNFWREDFPLPSNGGQPAFHKIAAALHGLLEPGARPFVVIINPGIIKFGHVEIVGISTASREAAQEVLQEAKRRLLGEEQARVLISHVTQPPPLPLLPSLQTEHV